MKTHWTDYKHLRHVVLMRVDPRVPLRDAIREVISRLMFQWQTYRAMSRQERRHFLRCVAYFHWLQATLPPGFQWSRISKAS